MASVTELGNGKYRVIISNGFKENGQRDRLNEVISAKSLASANNKAMQMEVEYKQKKSVDNNECTFGELVNRWREIKAPKLAPITQQGYDQRLDNIVLPAFAEKKIQEIKIMDIERFLQSLREDGARKDGGKGGYSEQSIKHCYRILHFLFECGMKWELCSKNPCHLAVEKESF